MLYDNIVVLIEKTNLISDNRFIEKLLTNKQNQQYTEIRLNNTKKILNDSIKTNSPKLIDTKSHLNKDENYSNNITDLEILKQQHTDQLNNTDNNLLKNSISIKINNIDKKIKLLKDQEINVNKATKELDTHNKDLNKHRENEIKIHDKLGKTYKNINVRSVKIPSDAELLRTLILQKNKLKDKEEINQIQPQINKELSNFILKNNEIKTQIDDLEKRKDSGIRNRIELTSLRNTLSLRNDFLNKIKK
jgi:hypothetical protein